MQCNFFLLVWYLFYVSKWNKATKTSHTNNQWTLNSNHSFTYHDDDNEHDITTCGNDYISKPSIGTACTQLYSARPKLQWMDLRGNAKEWLSKLWAKFKNTGIVSVVIIISSSLKKRGLKLILPSANSQVLVLQPENLAASLLKINAPWFETIA